MQLLNLTWAASRSLAELAPELTSESAPPHPEARTATTAKLRNVADGRSMCMPASIGRAEKSSLRFPEEFAKNDS
jgi:hypothetical protein